MPEAPRSRPADSVIELALSAHIKARPRVVFEALDARFAPATESETLYLADPRAFLVIEQGGWWYRAEYRVVPDEYGSHLEHRVINIAPQRRLGRGRKVLEEAPARFERLAKELKLELE